MKTCGIDGVYTEQLRVIPDERGRLMEIMRSDSPLFEQFGQVYMTTAYPGVVKGWHFHHKQADNMTVVKGMMKIVLYDKREKSITKGRIEEFFVGEHQPLLVHIPPYVLHGFKCISTEEAIVINVPTEVYRYDRPDEFRISPYDQEILYDWARKDG